MVREDWQVGQSGHTAEHNNIAHHLLDTFWVTDYGATGDGVTDDSAAFQAAINAAAIYAGTTREATLYIPRPKVKYRLAAGLVIQPLSGQTITPHISICGAGVRASQLWGDPGVTVLTIVCGENGLTNCTYEKFGIFSGSRGIYITQTTFDFGMVRCAFRDLLILDMTAEGMYADNAEILECTFEHVDIERCEYGGRFVNSMAFNVNRFVACQFRECRTRGLYVGEVVGALLFESCLWESNVHNALEIGDSHYGVTWINCWFENNGTDVSSGPYPHILIKANPASLATGTIRLLDTFFTLSANDGRYAIRITSDGIAGYLVVDGCGFYHIDGGKLDMGNYDHAPLLQLSNLLAPLTLEGNIRYPQPSIGAVNIPVYPDNAAALAVSLKSGNLYRTGDVLKVVH